MAVSEAAPAGALRVQVVWAHPRHDSLTAQVVGDVRDAIEGRGHVADMIDLYRLPFDPVMGEADMPDWGDPGKTYDPKTMAFIERTARADALVFVFPVWWYTFPAAMKGYIDRVWNFGHFYGDGRRMNLDSVLWIGLAGDTHEAFRKREYDQMMEHYLNVALAGFCGFNDSQVALIHNTHGAGIDDLPAHYDDIRRQARVAVDEMLARA